MGTVLGSLRWNELGLNPSPCCCPEDDEKEQKHVSIHEEEDELEPLSSESYINYLEDVPSPSSSVFNLESKDTFFLLYLTNSYCLVDKCSKTS